MVVFPTPPLVLPTINTISFDSIYTLTDSKTCVNELYSIKRYHIVTVYWKKDEKRRRRGTDVRKAVRLSRMLNVRSCRVLRRQGQRCIRYRRALPTFPAYSKPGVCRICGESRTRRHRRAEGVSRSRNAEKRRSGGSDSRSAGKKRDGRAALCPLHIRA